MSKLKLPDVTLVCIDTICQELAALAVRDCLDKADFGAVHIHTDKSNLFKKHLGSSSVFEDDNEIVFYKTDVDSMDAVMSYIWYDVPNHVETSHVLIMQWDSGIVDPNQWTDAFLQYDYIGAPWGWHGDAYEVGNGGFSLRSMRLMRFLNIYRDQFPMINPEDDTLCRVYRTQLEQNGFYFPPIQLASQFSFERTGYNGGKHFGYHGVFNWPLVFSEEDWNKRSELLLNNEYTKQAKHLGELHRMWAPRAKETA